jgi:hypothetical protein
MTFSFGLFLKLNEDHKPFMATSKNKNECVCIKDTERQSEYVRKQNELRVIAAWLFCQNLPGLRH